MKTTENLINQHAHHKAVNPQCLVFVKCGAFFETCGEDAIAAAKRFALTLTMRRDGTVLAGVPYHWMGRLEKMPDVKLFDYISPERIA